MRTLLAVLDAVTLDEFEAHFSPNSGNSGVLDANMGRMVQGHTVPSSLAIMLGRKPTIDGDIVNRFRWDSPGVPQFKKMSTHRELDQKEFLWDVLGKANVKQLWMNTPTLYPPEELNGVCVCGVLAPPQGRIAHPKKVERKLKTGEYVESDASHRNQIKEGYSYIHDVDKSQLSEGEIKDMAFEMIPNRTRHFLSIIEERGPFDFGYIWYSAPDRLKHHLHSFENPEELLGQLLDSLAVSVLTVIEETEPDNVILVSDHGFGEPPWRNNHHTRCAF